MYGFSFLLFVDLGRPLLLGRWSRGDEITLRIQRRTIAIFLSESCRSPEQAISIPWQSDSLKGR
jgi:hypothetical protein